MGGGVGGTVQAEETGGMFPFNPLDESGFDHHLATPLTSLINVWLTAMGPADVPFMHARRRFPAALP